jgi:hypothetical protein
MPLETYGDIRKAVTADKLDWTVNPQFTDETLIVRRSLGAVTENLVKAVDVPPVDVAEKVRQFLPANPFLLNELLSIGVITELPVELKIGSEPHETLTPLVGGTPHGPKTVVDWRNRWGTSWVTGIRDQDPCEHCWTFAPVALVESMVRIEHSLWCIRSEGDVLGGMATKCGQCGDPTNALNWMASNGIADPGCFPWPAPGSRTSTYFVPGPSTCGGGSMIAPVYTPTRDRSGRTVRIGAYTTLGSITNQKNWIQQIGPLVVGFDVYDDFFGWSGSTPYKKSSSASYAGGHIMTAVGFDDNLQCWIVKNSWGTGWGNSGWGLIAYGQCNIDGYAKYGLQGANPDPWTKRRLHSGAMIESGDGATHRNFELLATKGSQIAHYWRDNTASGFPWARAEVFGSDAAACPTLTATTYNRNFESVHLTTGRRLHHWFWNQSAHNWNDGGIFGPADAAGIPGFLESGYGPGNFEVVVRTADSKLTHWWRDTAFTWRESVRFGANVAYTGASLIQSSFGKNGNLELVCVLQNGQMQHFWRNDDSNLAWNAGVTFGSGLASPPCMIQGEYGMANENGIGNFELCVATRAGTVQHWWRNNQTPSYPWAMSATFGHNVQAVVSLIEGSFGFNLEVIVLRTDGELQHYWRDGAGWHEGAVIASIH